MTYIVSSGALNSTHSLTHGDDPVQSSTKYDQRPKRPVNTKATRTFYGSVYKSSPVWNLAQPEGEEKLRVLGIPNLSYIGLCSASTIKILAIIRQTDQQRHLAVADFRLLRRARFYAVPLFAALMRQRTG